MISILSVFLLLKNMIVKLWAIKPVRYIAIPTFEFNPSYIKSGKATFGIVSALSMLASVLVPGFIFVGITLFIQKAINTYKAPPLPIMYAKEDADEVLVADCSTCGRRKIFITEKTI